MKSEIRQKIVRIPFLHKLAWRIVNVGNHIFYKIWKIKNKPDKYWNQLVEQREKNICFIIGNGPSLSERDLKLLRNRDCFVSNRFYMMQSKIEFFPKYYVIQDRYCVDDESLNKIRAKHVFLGDYFWRTHNVSLKNAYCFKTKRAINTDKLYVGNVWSEIVDAYTVTFSMIQIAISLGYKQICLLGIDHNYPYTYDSRGNVVKNDGVQAHFYGGEGIEDFITNVEGMTKSYICTKQYADEKGIEIINCTRGGNLEIYIRKELEEVLSAYEE